VFAFDFTEKCWFVPKTDINSIFLIHDHNIPDQLYIMVLYISFYGFQKILNFSSKYNGVSFWFYRKRLLWQKLTETPYSMSVTSYSISVIHNDHVYKFLWLYKKIQILAQNPKVLAFAFTEKSRFLTKTDRNSIFHVQDSNILDQLYIMVLYIIFYSF
jgi:hypothetical protein